MGQVDRGGFIIGEPRNGFPVSVSLTRSLSTSISWPPPLSLLAQKRWEGQSPFLAVDRGLLVACTLGTLFKMVSPL